MTLISRPLLTTEYPDPADFRPENSAVYLFGTREEDRSRSLEMWIAEADDLITIQIEPIGQDSISIVSDDGREVALRDLRELESIFDGLWERHLYMDITGLSNHVWPALLRAVISKMRVSILYVEPINYAYSASPRENVFFDLSEIISGIKPIAQFNNLYEPEEDDVTFIPLLGFEGARFAHLLEEVQPPGVKL